MTGCACPKKEINPKRLLASLQIEKGSTEKLDSRLLFCDDSLLSDSSVEVTSVFSAPMGTQVTENARFMVLPAGAQIYDQNKLLE